MKLKQITYENLKGRSETVELGSANLIFGPNFAGKTTIIDAIKLLLLGYHPSLDKTARGTFELSSGEELRVSGLMRGALRMPLSATHTTSDAIGDHEIGRVWKRRDGKITRQDFVPMDWPEIPAVLLDANAYFGASDRGKTELLFSAAQIEGAITVPQINKRLLEYGLMLSQPEGQTVQQWIESSLVTVERFRSDAAASVRRMRGTVQGLSELRLKDSEPSTTAEFVKAKLAPKRADLEVLQRALGQGALRSESHEEAKLKSELTKLDLTNNELHNLLARRKNINERWEKVFSGTAGKLFCSRCKKKAEKIRDGDLKAVETEIKAAKNAVRFLLDEITALKPKAEKARKKAEAAMQRRTDETEEKIAGLREEIAALEKEEARAIGEQSERRRLKDAREELDKHELQEKRMGEAKAYLLGVKAEMTRELFVPILKVAERFTRGIFKDPLIFTEGQLGISLASKFGEGVYIPHRTFSGTEQAIAFAALQAALGATAPIKLVVMDELGRIDSKNKNQLLSNIESALSDGVIDQFIGIDTDLSKGFTAQLPDDWTLIERSNEKEFTLVRRSA
jgi:hypothetical protein